MLENLKEKGVKIALATSKPYEFSIKILKHFDLYKYFDFFGAGGTFGQGGGFHAGGAFESGVLRLYARRRNVAFSGGGCRGETAAVVATGVECSGAERGCNSKNLRT